MGIPSDITDLSSTAASNSPAGSETIGTNAGGYIRAAFAILNQETAGAFTDVASATTTDLGAVTSTNVRITGTTTITGFGTVKAGVVRYARFAAALTLTHNGTSLILPGAANITTAANDCLRAVSLGSGNWLVTHYQYASPKSDAYPVVVGSADATKKVRIEADGITTGTTRVITMPDADVTLLSTTAPTTWTPADGSGAGLSLTTSGCYYMKIGRLVHVQGDITFPVTANGANAAISMPITSDANASQGGGGVVYTDKGTYFTIRVAKNSVGANMIGTNGTLLTNADLSGKQFQFCFSYMAGA